MEYLQTLNYIHGRPRSIAAAPTLARIRDLMARLGNPQNSLKYVHIAGTNGKGSVAAMTASVLCSAGYKVGMFTSPYLEDFRERIQVNGQMIPEDDLCAITEKVKLAEDGRIAENLDPVNEFELVTAVAFVFFASVGCDLVVLETGLGGMHDPTNVILPPEVAVITHIAKDHTAILGSDIETIAGQKAGIIKSGSAVVVAPNEPEVIEVMAKACAEQGIEPALVKTEDYSCCSISSEGCSFTDKDGLTLCCSLLGRHQLTNAMTVYAALTALKQRGFAISDMAMQQGFASAKWPGRLELMSSSPVVLLDAAHNPDGASALADALDSLFPGKKIVAVIGMMADKEWKTCVDILAPKFSTLIASSSEMDRSLEPELLAQYASQYCGCIPCKDLTTAIKRGFDTVLGDGLLLVCGSVIMAGQARLILKNLLSDSE